MIDLGGGDELLFIDTHYYHVEDGTAIRQIQSPEIIKFWNQRPRTVIVGDLNAEWDAKEIEMLRDAGLQDALNAVGKATYPTWPADKPSQRLDYIWFSPDLQVSDVQLTESTASDHRGIAGTIEKR
jgi:endonuclease/exonuclease/phosphatase family metal-dependent hydrolase